MHGRPDITCHQINVPCGTIKRIELIDLQNDTNILNKIS